MTVEFSLYGLTADRLDWGPYYISCEYNSLGVPYPDNIPMWKGRAVSNTLKIR
jgi:hypothetical protein